MTWFKQQRKSDTDVNIGSHVDFEHLGGLKIMGAAVTATAAEINAGLIAGITATGADLNVLTNHAGHGVVHAVYHKATKAEVKAGHVLVAAVPARTLKVLGCTMQSIGGAAITATTVDIKDTDELSIIAIPVGLLTENEVVDSGASATNVFTDIGLAMTAGKGIMIQDSAKNNLDGSTHISVVVYYMVVA
jgi:hypothetical protein